MICLLCQELNEDFIKLTSQEGKAFNISSLLFKYFRFCFNTKPIDGDLCRNCWHSLVSFHEFYVRIETVYEKIHKNRITCTLDVTTFKEENFEEDEHIITDSDNSESSLSPIFSENFTSGLSQVDVNECEDFDQTDDTGAQFQQTTSYKDAVYDVLPKKSHKKYLDAYNGFVVWQKKYKETVSFDEPVLLDYFEEMSQNYKPTTLWSMYSMLKGTIFCNHNVKISTYSRLLELLKMKSNGFQPKKPKLFTDEEVKKFLSEAPDHQYLAMKAVMVLAVIGACRGEESTNFKTSYIHDNSNEIIIRIPETKDKNSKAYIIDGQFAEIVRKYMKLRPKNSTTDRFFMRYQDGKIRLQVIGRHKIANIPKEIAKYLQLPDSQEYTGHSFRGFDEKTFLAGSAAIDTLQKRKVDTSIDPKINLPRTINASQRNDTITTSSPSIVVASNSNDFISPHYYENVLFETIDDSVTTIDQNSIEFSDSDSCDAYDGYDGIIDDTSQDKSQKRYAGAYDAFTKWQKSKETVSFDEPILLAYFKDLSNTYKPSSLWSVFSMLRSTILSSQKINISEYCLLTDFLKMKAVGFQSKRTKAFTIEEVTQFLLEAPDDKYLAMKAVVVIGDIESWTVRDMTNFKTSYVKDNVNEIIIRTPYKKKHGSNVHIINGQLAQIVRKYMKLRPENSPTDRFFMRYVDGKCTLQIIGKNKISNIPKEVAKYLQLPNWQEYTGQSFRGFRLNKTTILCNNGSEIGTREQYRHKRKSENVSGPAKKIASTVTSHQNIVAIPPLLYFSPNSNSKSVFDSSPQENESRSDLYVAVKEKSVDDSIITIDESLTIKEEVVDEYFTITDESITTTTVSINT